MSRNHEEDQKSELEALESIYFNELQGELMICTEKHDFSNFRYSFRNWAENQV